MLLSPGPHGWSQGKPSRYGFPVFCYLELCSYSTEVIRVLAHITQVLRGDVIWGYTNPFHIVLSSLAVAAAKLLQSCPTLCNPRDGSPSGSPVPGILQARTLEWVAISFSNAGKWKVKVKSLSSVRLLVTPWTAAYQAPPSMGFSRQEYWSGVSLPSPLLFGKFIKNQMIKTEKRLDCLIVLPLSGSLYKTQTCWAVWCLSTEELFFFFFGI